MIKPNQKLKLVENKLKHDKNKEVESNVRAIKTKKNMDNIDRINRMVVFKGRPQAKRIEKKKLKKSDDSGGTKNEREEDWKRYVWININPTQPSHT